MAANSDTDEFEDFFSVYEDRVIAIAEAEHRADVSNDLQRQQLNSSSSDTSDSDGVLLLRQEHFNFFIPHVLSVTESGSSSSASLRSRSPNRNSHYNDFFVEDKLMRLYDEPSSQFNCIEACYNDKYNVKIVYHKNTIDTFRKFKFSFDFYKIFFSNDEIAYMSAFVQTPITSCVHLSYLFSNVPLFLSTVKRLLCAYNIFKPVTGIERLFQNFSLEELAEMSHYFSDYRQALIDSSSFPFQPYSFPSRYFSDILPHKDIFYSIFCVLKGYEYPFICRDLIEYLDAIEFYGIKSCLPKQIIMLYYFFSSAAFFLDPARNHCKKPLIIYAYEDVQSLVDYLHFANLDVSFLNQLIKEINDDFNDIEEEQRYIINDFIGDDPQYNFYGSQITMFEFIRRCTTTELPIPLLPIQLANVYDLDLKPRASDQFFLMGGATSPFLFKEMAKVYFILRFKFQATEVGSPDLHSLLFRFLDFYRLKFFFDYFSMKDTRAIFWTVSWTLIRKFLKTIVFFPVTDTTYNVYFSFKYFVSLFCHMDLYMIMSSAQLFFICKCARLIEQSSDCTPEMKECMTDFIIRLCKFEDPKFKLKN